MSNLKDVASLAGISVTTASRVLNNRGYIGEETRNKVYDAMKQLNYQPNEIARSLFRQHTNIIGVIVPSVSNPFFGKLTELIEIYAVEKGFKILLCNSFHEKEKEIEYIQMLKSNKVDGIIIGSRTTDLGKYMDIGLPFVSIDRILSENTPCVSSDNYQGGELATQFLIKKGCKNLVFIGGSPNLNLMANKRNEAFTDVCEKAGIKHMTVTTGENQFSAMDYTECIDHLFCNNPQCDGIFASSDIIAAQVIQVAAKNGRKVPRDVKIVGYDDVIISELTLPKITTVRQPIDQISRYAVNIIADEIKGEIVPRRTVLPVSLIVRDST